MRTIIKNISTRILKNNNNKEDIFIFNRLLINKYKIIFLIKSNIVSVGIFSYNSSRGFQNLLLIHLFVSLINFKGDSITKLNLINNYINKENNTPETLKEYQEEQREEIIKNNLKDITNIDFLEIFIYDKYFLKPCILHFQKVFWILTKKEDINLSFTKFLDLYIIDISSDTLLLDLNEILYYDIKYKHDLSNNKYYKYYKNKNIFKEILFHSHQLYNSYNSKYGTKFIKGDSSQRFIKVECTSTFPRILFIIQFIPVLKGIIIIHLYFQSKLSRVNNNNISINQENRYKEVDLVFGSFFGERENGDMDLKYLMPKKLSNIEKFMEEFFITTRNSDFYKLNEPQKEFKYFNYYIINIINSIPIDTINTSFQKIFEYINDKIKSKYQEENNKKKSKINKKYKKYISTEQKNIRSVNKLNIKKEKNANDNNNNDSLDKLFSIDKYIYDDFLQNFSEKYSSIQNNFSTIRSNNKNIINILRESDSSIKINNIYINKNKKTISIKEEESFIKKEKPDIKTINLTSEASLISKENDGSKIDIEQDFSLISTIKKNDNKKLFNLKYNNTKENTNLKNVKLLDLLNSSTSNYMFNSINITKKRRTNIEGSSSDLINKESSNDIKIKKSDKKKPTKKLVLLDSDV